MKPRSRQSEQSHGAESPSGSRVRGREYSALIPDSSVTSPADDGQPRAGMSIDLGTVLYFTLYIGIKILMYLDSGIVDHKCLFFNAVKILLRCTEMSPDISKIRNGIFLINTT